MTLEDLREHGVLLPEEEWGEHPLRTTVPELPLLLCLVLAAASLVLAYAGDGGPLTWIGISAFLVLLLTITWLSDRAVLRQQRRTRRERGTAGGGSDADPTGGAEAGDTGAARPGRRP